MEHSQTHTIEHRSPGLAESTTVRCRCEKLLQMKLISAISIAMLALSSLFTTRSFRNIAQNVKTEENAAVTEEITDFEKAVEIIKKYEGLHSSRHWPLVGYGHKVLPGEKYSRSKPLSEKEAEALLRKDLLKNCAVFRSFGADSLILGVLAYNIGSGATLRSSVAKKLKAGDRNIYENYIAHSRYRGKVHSQIKKRRIEEFETLFIREPAKNSTEKEELIVSQENITASILKPCASQSVRNFIVPAKCSLPTYNSTLACILK